MVTGLLIVISTAKHVSMSLHYLFHRSTDHFVMNSSQF